MPKIQVLSAHIANQIAAGEVIERPASIVKELVENAVDAGATVISIEIENGGVDRIRIADNGCGIADDDVETAFLRHATSKLHAAEDLNHMDTLGFRGEALASIAAVSSVTLQTCTLEDELGSEVTVRGGSFTQHRRIGCTVGTTIEVRELFFNAPARLKFLKSARAESGAVGDYVAKLIMSLPAVSFRYTSNGKTVYQSVGDGDLKNAILCVYGVETAAQLCHVSYDDGYIRLDGYIGTPALSRFNRSAQSFFLNRRIIRSAALSNVLSRAYDTRLMIGRFAFAVLPIQIASAEVDVNVHPAKLEVRFRDEARVVRTLHVACTEALTRSYVPPAMTEAVEPPLPRSTWPQSRRDTWSAPETERPVAVQENYHIDDSIPRIRVSSAPDKLPGTQREELTAPFSAPFTIVGCAFLTYWFVQQGETLYCIDQHAAHERLLYDALMFRDTPAVSQALLFPESVTLSPSELETFQSCRRELEAFGFLFTMEPDSLEVTLLAVPQIHGAALKTAFLHDALEQLSGSAYQALDAQSIMRGSIAQTACKHAVKAGEPIAPEQMETLLTALSDAETLLTCPHGRPVAVRLTKTELEKWFKRIP